MKTVEDHSLLQSFAVKASEPQIVALDRGRPEVCPSQRSIGPCERIWAGEAGKGVGRRIRVLWQVCRLDLPAPQRFLPRYLASDEVQRTRGLAVEGVLKGT